MMMPLLSTCSILRSDSMKSAVELAQYRLEVFASSRYILTNPNWLPDEIAHEGACHD